MKIIRPHKISHYVEWGLLFFSLARFHICYRFQWEEMPKNVGLSVHIRRNHTLFCCTVAFWNRIKSIQNKLSWALVSYVGSHTFWLINKTGPHRWFFLFFCQMRLVLMMNQSTKWQQCGRQRFWNYSYTKWWRFVQSFLCLLWNSLNFNRNKLFDQLWRLMDASWRYQLKVFFSCY